LVTFGLGAVFLYVFSGSSERVMNNTLDEALYMLAVAEHGTAPIDPADEQAVLSDLARRLQQRFRLYSMQTYLLNDEGQLVLHLHMAPGMPASSSQAPLVVGSKTLPGQAAALRQMITVDRNADEAVRALVSAGVRRAVALPLLDDETLLGVVIAQGDSDTAFVPGEVSGLRLLVQQTARMIGVARRLKTLTALADEANEHLSTLTGIMRAQEEQIRKDVKSGWNEYLKQHSTGSFGFDMEFAATSRRLLPAEDMPAELRATMERGEPIVEQRAGAQLLNMPIVFRGELLGAMSFTMPANQRVTERQIELARGVIERLGAALENARLLEQTRAQAQREARASIVGTRLLGITDVQTVLDLAANEFQTALGAVYTRIYVQASAADDHTRTTQEAS
jgi:GAF domain-containing protein